MDAIFDKKTIIIFDTSFWLDIYRNLPDTIETITSALNKEDFVSKIYIPSFVAKEFDKNKHKVMSEHKTLNIKVRDALTDAIKNGKAAILGAIQTQKNRYKIENASVENKINKLLTKIENNGKSFLADSDSGSSSYLKVEELFNTLKSKNYIDELTKNDVLDLFINGENRFKQKIPPGFMDTDKDKKGGFVYGDLIIWKEIIAYSKKNKKDILFVTNDTKKDWFENDIFHPKLIEEFINETNQKIMGISAKTFYEHASINKGLDILSFIEFLIDDLYQALYDELGDENNNILNPYEELSNYSGDFYELDEIFEYYMKEYSIHFNKDIIEIKLEINFKADIKSANYSGRDDETKEVILYPYYTHDISGTVEFTIEKKLNELLYNNREYNLVDVSGNCYEISCKNLNEDDY